MLHASTDFTTADVAHADQSRWHVERAPPETNSTRDVRPAFHPRDDTAVGHIVAGFLALRLEVDLRGRLDKSEVDTS